VDPNIPREFAPYGIQTITAADGSETIWVTYTALDNAQSGFVDAFTTTGVLLSHLALKGPLHSPWGVAFAPPDFGPMSNAILVTNNISRGRIDAFDPITGDFLGPLRDTSGKPIEIDGVWAIQFVRVGRTASLISSFSPLATTTTGAGRSASSLSGDLDSGNRADIS
jgi:uncharacterized protein (TIGR03118 family)